MVKELKNLILKYALKNAVSYNGKANTSAVLGKILSEKPELRSKIKELGKEISGIVANVNFMSLIEQESKLIEIAPEMMQEKGRKPEVRISLPDLPNAVNSKVVMRFEPSPSGALHIGHAITFLLNAEYCRKYSGKLFLRIADTNAPEIYVPAYKMIPEEAKWLTNYPFTVKYQSDNMKKYYDYAEKLIRMGKAYVCTCSSLSFKKLVDKGKACAHRELSVEEQLKEWKKMHSKYKQGQAVLRIKTNLNEKNPALREFPAFRIVDSTHPKTGKKYRVWPLMNFSVAIDDYLSGMTHVIRGKDHVVNTERQIFIFNYFGWKKPYYIHLGRINFSNMHLSATQTREAIKKGKYSGWDDIRLPFIAALRKRGILPEAFSKYAIEIGPSKVDKTLSIEEFMHKIYDYNKKILDEHTRRYFFVDNPVKIKIKDAPKLQAKVPLHPEKNLGFRNFKTNREFYISREDLKNMKKGNYRLMHLFNFVNDKGFEFHSEELKPELKAKLIHWLPANSKQIIKTSIKMPSGKVEKGLSEKNTSEVRIGQVIQFERFGFCCKQKEAFWFAHK